MKLKKFNLTADNLGITYNGQTFDLSRSFIFVGFDYDIINRELIFKWIKGVGDEIHKLPDEVTIEFADVLFFKARERDISQPYPRDEFVTAIGFTANEKVKEIGGPYRYEPDENHSHLCLEFSSGFGIKFTAGTATIKTRSSL